MVDLDWVEESFSRRRYGHASKVKEADTGTNGTKGVGTVVSSAACVGRILKTG